ncbi:MAG: hypothetical protein A2589_01315 [Candidatus Vogelbacteria bacterium RIFOXYD1_FULL_46_19]|uniref:Uncharacterized protein n=1 Tax=Candidatus Vogelbacteria bacterium RIFOXYD1_FULL_46_19 TaxID=1802439 RepID=A0A1G2QFU4_9BACT|nr:MAG: hypothetical protein A2589_01315 [Candidatus Vogelbacteria bacterium RIFOXYD1_FULL_46_19]
MVQSTGELLKSHTTALEEAFRQVGTDTSQDITYKVLAWLAAELPPGSDLQAEKVEQLVQRVTRHMGSGEGKAATLIYQINHLFSRTPEATTRRAV